MTNSIIKKDNSFERSYTDLATRILVPESKIGPRAPFIQRSKSRSTIRAPRGAALLQATDYQGFSEQGGACIVHPNWAISVAHCGATLNERGIPEATWVDMTLSLGCEDRDIQKVVYGINEIFIHKYYTAYRGGFAFDIMAMYSKAPFPDEHILTPRRRSMFNTAVGEQVSIPNLGSQGEAGNPNDGDLNQFIENDIMKVSNVTNLYTDLETVDGDVARPGASGWPAWDNDGDDLATFMGLTSHVDTNRTQTTLTPALMISDWFNELRPRVEVARQMGLFR